MIGRRKASSMLMAAMVATSLSPAAALGLQSDSSPTAATATSYPTQATSPSGVAKAKVSKKNIRSLYKGALKQAVEGEGVFNEQYSHLGAYDGKHWDGNLKYAVYDADRNGTPELLVQAGCFTYDKCWHMFTVSDKKLRYLGKFGSGNLVSKGNSGKLFFWDQRQGYRWICLVTILNGEARSGSVVFDSGESSGYPDYKRYVKSSSLKAVKTSSPSKYGLLKQRVS